MPSIKIKMECPNVSLNHAALWDFCRFFNKKKTPLTLKPFSFCQKKAALYRNKLSAERVSFGIPMDSCILGHCWNNVKCTTGQLETLAWY